MNLVILLDMAASADPDRVALGPAATGVTFAELRAEAARGAGLLHRAGTRNAVLLARNGPVMPRLLLAGALAGIPFTALNYRLSADRIREQCDRLEHPLVVADDDYAGILDGRAEVLSVSEFAERCRTEEPFEVSPDGAEVAAQLFTSGTTAAPKIVPLRHENLFSYVTGTVEFGGAGPDEAALVCVPPYHVAALGSVLTNLYAGRRVAYLPDFDPRAWLDTVAAERVTSAMLVPTMISRIVDLPGGVPELPSLRQITYGGAKMPAPVLERALLAFPGCGFVNAYGLTETSSTIALLTPEDHRLALASDDPAVAARLASVGRPVPGIELEVRDEQDRVLGPGEPGELWVRGPQISGRYVGLGSVLDAGGWFPTRDRAHLDAAGYLFVEGRSDDTIIRGGENIAPAEIEDVLLRHPGVAEAVVVGVPDEEWGERLVAVLVRRGSADPSAEEIKAWVRERMRGSRTPDDVVWRAELPQTSTGKILRRQIVDDVATVTSVQ
jgi:acyl-CoA synthetase (AMP-forming)/AMP-acid ligase II